MNQREERFVIQVYNNFFSFYLTYPEPLLPSTTILKSYFVHRLLTEQSENQPVFLHICFYIHYTSDLFLHISDLMFIYKSIALKRLFNIISNTPFLG